MPASLSAWRRSTASSLPARRSPLLYGYGAYAAIPNSATFCVAAIGNTLLSFFIITVPSSPSLTAMSFAAAAISSIVL